MAWVEPDDTLVHPPFWLVTRYDDVMRMSKDNATFLNNPHSVVFSLTEGLEFAKQFSGGSEHMVASLVTFDCADPHEVSQADAGVVHAQEPARHRGRDQGHRPRRPSSGWWMPGRKWTSASSSPRPIRCMS